MINKVKKRLETVLLAMYTAVILCGIGDPGCLTITFMHSNIYLYKLLLIKHIKSLLLTFVCDFIIRFKQSQMADHYGDFDASTINHLACYQPYQEDCSQGLCFENVSYIVHSVSLRWNLKCFLKRFLGTVKGCLWKATTPLQICISQHLNLLLTVSSLNLRGNLHFKHDRSFF